MLPDEAARVASIIDHIARRNEPFALLENTLWRKDGTPAIIEVNGLPIVDERGAFRGYRGIARDITERKESEERRRVLEAHTEEQKRQFYRKTLLSVTGGKLDICELAEIRPYIRNAQINVGLKDLESVAHARHEVRRFCRQQGLRGDRLDLFMLGVGEAITNGIKHAARCRIYAGTQADCVWVGVADKGRGIEALVLPQSILQRGFSTKLSMGMGYSIMLDVIEFRVLP